MARRRFFVPQVRRGTAELTGNEADHLVRVLRAEVGQLYEISDNQDLYLARVTMARKSAVVFEVVEKLPAPGEPTPTTLLTALFKFDRFEWMVEKATELGVSEIVPLESDRTERGLMQAAHKRRIRWERIALEAGQQARRTHLPIIAEAVKFASAVKAPGSVKVFLDENAPDLPILRALPHHPLPTQQLLLLVGPEGGWIDSERAEALDNGWVPCSLGTTILRAETAAIAALSVLRAWAEAGNGMAHP